MADMVLIVDDDAAVLTLLNKVIRSNGMVPECVDSAEKSLELLQHHTYDVILMDVNMRGMDGFAAVDTIRRKGINTPVIIISGRAPAGSREEDFDTLYGLDIGADDYITKPFNPVTLGAKIKALLRRSRKTLVTEDNIITAGPFAYNTSTLRLSKNGVEISLSAKENAMMKLFMDNVNRVFSKDMLYDMIWGEAVIDENAIMVYISRLRQKIEDSPSAPRYIQNVRGIGYRFVI